MELDLVWQLQQINLKETVMANSKVLVEMENGGKFTIELYPEYAPATVANFEKLVKAGFKCDLIERTGMQKLTGTQALCYSRIRKIDGDVERGNRQKEVLAAMFARVKDMNVAKLPKIAEMVFSECQTSLSSSDIMSMGLWAISSKPEMENMSMPNDNVKGKGQTIRGVWYYVYDIEAAAAEMKKFILETE